MTRLLTLILTACLALPMSAQSYEDFPVYAGEDLGVNYRPESTTWKVWSPQAEVVMLRLYATPLEGKAGMERAMARLEQSGAGGEMQPWTGTWALELPGDFEGSFYTIQVRIDGEWLEETPDPYAVSVGTNGKRAQVVDLRRTDPEAWSADRRPVLATPADIVLYEAHVRDLSIHPASGVRHPGKYLALAERGTHNAEGLPTVIDHIAGLGVTHVHLLPVFDFGSVDESREDGYNWGYDPMNYNVPEGSYATDPADGRVRIREFKQMVMGMHDAGLRLIMDVVYNHTFSVAGQAFERTVPGYYYRQNIDGSLSNASGCGNEIASERPMVRAFILHSIRYWATEYHVDGFRFDLMGVHDRETMRSVRHLLDEIDPSLFVYGEGWTAGASPLPDFRRAVKKYTYALGGVAAFSDDFRDGVKGAWHDVADPGFVCGRKGMIETLKFGLVGAIEHPQVDMGAVNYSDTAWAAQPTESINYVSCHDNHTLWDKLLAAAPKASETERSAMHRLALTLVLTGQGVPFLHAGTEFARSKGGDHNSYKSGDTVNRMDWSALGLQSGLVSYVRGLIALRKAHPAFRMGDADAVRSAVQFEDFGLETAFGMRLDGAAAGDSWNDILVLYNGGGEDLELPLPEGRWALVGDGSRISLQGALSAASGSIEVPARTALILADFVSVER